MRSPALPALCALLLGKAALRDGAQRYAYILILYKAWSPVRRGDLPRELTGSESLGTV